MGETTGISWSDGTWNPWYGCEKISPGCKFCYMYRDMERYGRDPFTVQRSKTTFRDPLKWKEPRLVFTCSWSDFFIEAADGWRDEAWEIIRQTPHTYQILTKRPELIAERLPKDWGAGYENVWLGVSAENQECANRRIPALLNVPARIRWVSAEPLLEGIDFWEHGPEVSFSWLNGFGGCDPAIPGIDWVVAGGESGSDRVCEVSWITNIVDQCRAAKVPVFVKQDSGARAGKQGRIPDSYWVHEYPGGVGR